MRLIIGATGTNGRTVLDRLAKSGERTRALVRNPSKAADLASDNVEVVKGDLDDRASLEAALQGVDHVFFSAAVDPRLETWFQNLLDAAKSVGGGLHVVKLSALGANPKSPVELLKQHGETDLRLIESGLGYTILRPNSFYQNMLWSVDSIKHAGAFYIPMGDAKQSLVDVRDIASVAVAAMTTPGHEGKTYVITGPEPLTYHDIASTLSRVLGKPVQYVPVTFDAARDAMIQAGSPAWNAQAVADLFGFLAEGNGAATTKTVEVVTGKAPITFAQFAEEHADLFR